MAVSDLSDSAADDIFITQTAPEHNILDQSVEYGCDYLDSQYESNWSIPMGDVEYWDFTGHPDTSSVAPSLPLHNDFTSNQQEPFVPLDSDDYFADDENVSLSNFWAHSVNCMFSSLLELHAFRFSEVVVFRTFLYGDLFIF